MPKSKHEFFACRPPPVHPLGGWCCRRRLIPPIVLHWGLCLKAPSVFRRFGPEGHLSQTTKTLRLLVVSREKLGIGRTSNSAERSGVRVIGGFA